MQVFGGVSAEKNAQLQRQKTPKRTLKGLQPESVEEAFDLVCWLLLQHL